MKEVKKCYIEKHVKVIKAFPEKKKRKAQAFMQPIWEAFYENWI